MHPTNFSPPEGRSRPEDWHRTHDLDRFLSRAGDFLRSRPALHTVALSVTEALRTRGPSAFGDGAAVFGTLERDGVVRAAYFRTPPHRLQLTALTADEAGSLAAHLAGLGGQPFPGVGAEEQTAAVFVTAWQALTGARAEPPQRQRLYRLGTLTAPHPLPAGRARIADAGDRDQLADWYRAFGEEIGDPATTDADAWVDARLAYGGLTLWESPDGTPVALAGATPRIAGQVRVAPVYTPPHLRGRGYAGAATAEVSRAARDAGADEVLLFTDLANPTSNRLYQRLGYRPVTDFAQYDFTPAPAATDEGAH